MTGRHALAVIATLVLALTGCVQEDQDRRTGSPTELLSPPVPAEVEASQLAKVPTPDRAPLRAGEERMTLTMAEPYTPAAPAGAGTDDYRCFLLDPQLAKDAWLTGTNVLPGNPEVVHHVILFRVPAEQVDEAEALDAETADPGWTCFGGSGLPGEFANTDDAPWLGAWAPGTQESLTRDGYGVRLDAGSRIVMQVHYNLLEGAAPDTSSTEIRWMPGGRALTPVHTYLLPAPVEMPCRPDHDDGALCDREAAVADVIDRFGPVGNTNNLLHLLCGTDVAPSNTTSCTRTVGRPMTILGAAGHMHLLGREISIVTDPGGDREQTVLDIPVWDFDDQGIKRVDPVELQPFDTIRVTCRHVQWLRDVLPAFAGQEEKYVVWGEGTTDEMCLGILQVAYGEPG